MRFIDVKKMDVLHRITLPKAALEAIGAKKNSFIGVDYGNGYIRLTTNGRCSVKKHIDALGRVHLNEIMRIGAFLAEPEEISVFVHRGGIILGLYDNLAS